MHASSCYSHPSLIPTRVISSWSSRITTASLPTPLTFFLPLSSFAAHLVLRMSSFNSTPNTFQRASHWTSDNPDKWLSFSSFSSLSQIRACESANWRSNIQGTQVDAPFLPYISCNPRSAFLPPRALHELVSLAFRLGSCSAAASAVARCFFSLISRVRSAPEARRSASEGRGGGGGGLKERGLGPRLSRVAIFYLDHRHSTQETEERHCPESVHHTQQCFFFFCDTEVLSCIATHSLCPLPPQAVVRKVMK